MNKKGIMLVELLISIVFTSIILIGITSIIVNMLNLLNQGIVYKIENEEKTSIYKYIAPKFAKYNIKNITKNQNNNYTIECDKDYTMSISIENQNLNIDSQQYKKDKFIQYNNLKLEKKQQGEKSYILLTIDMTLLNKNSNIVIYYVNDEYNGEI